jgi:hypothetical protein
MQGKPALNRCTTRMSCRWGVASTCISLRCILYMLHIMYIFIYLFIYCLYFITLQRSGTRPVTKPFVPYVRNTAERSIHNFDSGPYIYGNVIKPFCNVIKPFCLGDIFWSQNSEFQDHPSTSKYFICNRSSPSFGKPPRCCFPAQRQATGDPRELAGVNPHEICALVVMYLVAKSRKHQLVTSCNYETL